jgi:cytochrome c
MHIAIKFVLAAGTLLVLSRPIEPAAAQDVEAGRAVFQTCRACHLLVVNRHMTGPSLAGVFGRKAGTVQGFPRYSPAMRAANIEWNAETLDTFLRDPQGFIRGNWMGFQGIQDPKERADLIAYLRLASVAAMTAPAPRVPTLKELGPQVLVTAIRLCGDAFYVTTADGATKVFWEFNLRFKTNSTVEGPDAGKPAIVRAGSLGDRASVVFATPREISDFVTLKCE